MTIDPMAAYAASLGFTRTAPGGGPLDVPPAPLPGGGSHAEALPSAVLTPTALTFAAVREMLYGHELGRFTLSAALARLALRDPDLAGAMNQRLLALVGADHCIEAATNTGPAERYARDLATDFRTMVTRGTELDIVRDGVMLGAGCGQAVWWWREGTQDYLPVLEPWPMDSVERDIYTGVWYALTRQGQRIPITPGDGRWLLYTPWSDREPYFYGAVRQFAEWFLRAANAAKDYGRYIELSGQGILKAKLPSGSRGSPERANFINSLRGLGRNAVVPLPQGPKPEESYDLELEAISADLHKIFVEMLRIAGGKLRLSILGQDLTSQNAKVGTNASSETGMKVNGRVSRADSATWRDCLQSQFIVPWAAYRGRPELAPSAYYDLEDDDDAQGEAAAANVAADALTKWQKLLVDGGTGRVVDVLAAAERWGVPTVAAPADGARAAVRRLVLRARGNGLRAAA